MQDLLLLLLVLHHQLLLRQVDPGLWLYFMSYQLDEFGRLSIHAT